MTYNAMTLPPAEPMMIRKFTPMGDVMPYGGLVLMVEYDVEEIGLADLRLEFDEDVVDCSHRIFQLTTYLMMGEVVKKPTDLTVFPSRRWRNMRKGDYVEDCPSESKPLLFLGNPIVITMTGGMGVHHDRTYRIKSGMGLGY